MIQVGARNMNYDEGQGWHDARIVPYQPISLDPSAVVFHYAQECFEGMKAYRTGGNQIQLFRPDCNARRMQNTHERLCIPPIPVEDFVDAVKAIVEVEKDWVPHSEGASLYIRPFTIATMIRSTLLETKPLQMVAQVAESPAAFCSSKVTAVPSFSVSASRKPLVAASSAGCCTSWQMPTV